MKQRWGLDRNNVLWPTPGDLWGVEQHHWNTEAKENQQLNPGEVAHKTKMQNVGTSISPSLHDVSVFQYLEKALMELDKIWQMHWYPQDEHLW